MADCLSLLYDSFEGIDSPYYTVRYSGCSADGTVHIGRSTSNGSIYALTNYTDPPSLIVTLVNSASSPVVDSDDDVWWVETADFVTFTLRRSEIDGSSVTNVATITGLPTFDFEIPEIRYDPHADRFWFAYFTSPDRGLWTMSKAGVCVKRYAATNQTGWGAVVADDAAVWGRFGTDVVRVDGTSFTATTGTAETFSNNFAPTIPTGSGGAIWTLENGASYEYGPGVTKDAAPCDMVDYDDYGALPTPYWTPDYSQIFLSQGNHCAGLSIIWGMEVETGGPMPLMIYARGDDLPTGAPVLPISAWSWQRSSRLFQSGGHA